MKDIKELESELSRQPSVEIVSTLIDAYLEQRDPRSLEKALSLVLKNLEKYSQEPVFLHRATQVLVLIKNNAEAMKLAADLANRLIELQPDQIKWYSNAAYIQWRQGNLAAAIELSEFALNRVTDLPPADDVLLSFKGNLAYYYAERGRRDDAEQARRLALEAYKGGPTPSRGDTLGYVFLRFAANRGDLEKAIQYLREAQTELRELGRLENPLVEKHLREAEARLQT